MAWSIQIIYAVLMILVGSYGGALADTQAGSKKSRSVDQTALIGLTREGVSCVLGGGRKGELVDGKSIAARIRHRQVYSLVTLEGFVEQTWTVGRPVPIAGGEDCRGQFSQELTLLPGRLKTDSVAVSGEKTALGTILPRSLKIHGANHARARKIVSDFLIGQGIVEPKINIRQAIEADLDSNGKAELIVVASHITPGTSKKGDYALVLVHSEQTGAPRVFRVSVELATSNADQQIAFWQSALVAVVDANRDGIFELVFYGWFLYGDGWEVFNFDGSAIKRRMVCGCGG